MQPNLLLRIKSSIYFEQTIQSILQAMGVVGSLKSNRLVVGIAILGILCNPAGEAWSQEYLIGLTSNGGSAGKGTAFSIKPSGSNFTILKAFADWGKYPVGSLTLGSDGNFYGLTPESGTHNKGAIFKVTSAGKVTILHQFDNLIDGGAPRGKLIQGRDGNFYGMTSTGGFNNNGTIFKITPVGIYTVLYSLTPSKDGSNPQGSLVQGSDGNFYGMAYSGGTNGDGTIFKITPAGIFTVIRHLKSATDGRNPYNSLIQGTDGSLYGMLYIGGTYNYGTIFKITTGGTYTVLRHLQPADGAYPHNNLVQGSDGYLYGLAERGGSSGHGTIFKIKPTGASFTILRNLNSSTDGAHPGGGLVKGNDGNYYGLTSSSGPNGGGTIFMVTPAGKFTVLRSFTEATDGSNPVGSLVKGSDGNFYGMAQYGGSNTYGTIFKISSAGTFTVLNHFNGSKQGNAPFESLVKGTDNAYYGTTSSGGAYNFGTIIKICGGTLIVLRSLNRNTDGAYPKGSLVQGTDGAFYGMTSDGGTNSGGTIFKITSGGTFTVLRHLKYATDGSNPEGSLVQGTDGYFYGMTNTGGSKFFGTIFKINAAGTFKVLRHFLNTTDGAYPEGSLIKGSDGNFYGMTSQSGRIFKITPTGTFIVLRTLISATDGNTPLGNLVQGRDGNFYGTTSGGGNNGAGTIFKLTKAGSFSTLRHLNSTTDGSNPRGSLVQASDGNFYGLTSTGGSNKAGTLFKITSSGSFSVLRHFNLARDGGAAMGSLILVQNNLVAQAQSVTTIEETAKTITLTGTGSSTLTYTIVSGPKNGTLSGTGANRTYTPKANFAGTDVFTFTVNRSCQASALATVSIRVSNINDAPVLAAIGNKTATVGKELSFTATATDPDVGQTKTFSLVGAPAGAIIGASTGTFRWTPSTAGSYRFSVKVSDNASPALTDQELITVTVTTSTTASTVNHEGEITQLLTNLYPNPVSDKLTLILNIPPDPVTATITDIKGEVMYTNTYQLTKQTPLEIVVANWKPGIYVLKLQSQTGYQIVKFVKE